MDLFDKLMQEIADNKKQSISVPLSSHGTNIFHINYCFVVF